MNGEQLTNGGDVVGDISEDDIDVEQEKVFGGVMDKMAPEKW